MPYARFRPLAAPLACFALAAAAALSPVPASAASPFLVVPDPATAEASPAYRYANMTNEEALAELDRRQILYTKLDAVPGVRAPVRLTGRLHGVYVHSSLPPDERVTSMFEILDARLALALDDFAAVLERHDIEEVVHYTMYRPNVPAPREGDAGDHDHGVAAKGAAPGKRAAGPEAKPEATAGKRAAGPEAKPEAMAGKRAAEPEAKPEAMGGKRAAGPEAKPEATAGKRAAGPEAKPEATAGKRVAEAGSKPAARKRAAAAKPAPSLGKKGARDGAKAHGGSRPEGLKQKDGPVAPKAHGEAAAEPAVARPARGAATDDAAARPAAKAAPRLGKWAPPGTRHPAGLAIDVAALKKRDGSWISVARHFDGHIGERTCGEGARVPGAPEARELRSIVCESMDLGVFTYVLTPNYNAAHADHYHMEIKPGVRWFLVH